MVPAFLTLLKSKAFTIKNVAIVLVVFAILIMLYYRDQYENKVAQLAERDAAITQLELQVKFDQQKIESIVELTKTFEKVDKSSKAIRQSIGELKQKQGVERDEEILSIANSISTDFNTKLHEISNNKSN